MKTQGKETKNEDKSKEREKEQEVTKAITENIENNDSLTPAMSVKCSRIEENAALRLLIKPALESSSDQKVLNLLSTIPIIHKPGPLAGMNNKIEILHDQAH